MFLYFRLPFFTYNFLDTGVAYQDIVHCVDTYGRFENHFVSCQLVAFPDALTHYVSGFGSGDRLYLWKGVLRACF